MLSIAVIIAMTATVMTWLTWTFVPWTLAGQCAIVLWWGWTDNLVRTPDTESPFAPLYLHFVRLARPFLSIIAITLTVSTLFRYAPWAECAVWALTLGGVAWWLPERQPVRWRSAIASAMLLMASTVAVLLIVDIGARQFVAPVPPPSDLYMPDPATIFTLRPNVESPCRVRNNVGEWIETNASISSQGIRGPEYGPKAADEFRIVILGDSFTFGHALRTEENFPYVLEQALNTARLPKRITAINCGVPGFAPWQERLFLHQRGFGFEPDLVILQVFPANDVPGTLTRAGKRLPVFDMAWETRLANYQRKAGRPERTARWLDSHCRTYVALTRVLDRPELAWNVLADLRFVGGTVPRIAPPEAGIPNLEASRIEVYPELEEAWRMLEEDLHRIQTDCRERGVDLFAFCHPYPIDDLIAGVSEADRRQMGTEYEQDLDVRRTRGLFQRAGIPDVDVTAALQSHPRREDLHFKYDGHFTAEGAEVVANALAEHLLHEYFSGTLNATLQVGAEK